MSLADRAARRVLVEVLRRLGAGRLEVVEPGGARLVFEGAKPGPTVIVQVRRAAAWRALLRGSTGLAESYADDLWDCDDLVGLIRLAALNMGGLDRARERFAPLLVPGQRLASWIPRNTLPGARDNIAAHYDLGNELFALFLDETMSYSCAIFESPTATLQEASAAKLEAVCRKLELRPTDHLLEIGSGWGGLAVHAAHRHGCRVTTTTISAAQRDFAARRVQEAGLADRVTVLQADYRELRGRFDKLASIEMIEAVGWQYFDSYFERASGLLAPDGLMLLQAITIDDRAYEGEKASRSFANRHVFPGGCLPSQAVIAGCLARCTDMRTLHVQDITPHYAETLRRWREGFLARATEAEALGYDRRFRRMWEMYLSYSEAGFRECRIGDVQILLAKPAYRGSLAIAAAAPAASEVEDAGSGEAAA